MSFNPIRCVVLLLIAVTAQASVAQITILNTDPPGIGFNDTTPAEPVGGNPGITVGEQRLNAFTLAADIWSVITLTTTPIVVRASFSPLSCSANQAVLGAAGPIAIQANFSGAPQLETWYVISQANYHSGRDLDPGAEEILASFNGSIDNNDSCLNNRNWYYGLDNNPPGSDIDFVNVLMHELAHGLGFFSLTNVSTGSLPSNRPDIFARLAFDTSQSMHLSEMNDGQRLVAQTASGNLVWDGPQTAARAADFLDAGLDSNGFVRLFAPGTIQPGSSVAHFDSIASPNLLMEPSLQSSVRARYSIDLTANFMADIGWNVPDSDLDLVTDLNDNCVLENNPRQTDADGDLYGNMCDADLNNNGVVNTVDLGLFRARFFSADPVADFNGDGIVNTADLGILRRSFFRSPGPSGLIFP